MAERRATVLLAQLTPATNDVITSAHRVGELLADYASVDLAVFPELFLNGNSLGFAHESSTALGSRVVQRLRDAARRSGTALVVGAVERTYAQPSGAVLCIDETGLLAGVYRKVHLSDEEERYLAAGSSLTMVRLAGLSVGILTGGDLAFAAAAGAMARAGTDLLVTVDAAEIDGIDEQLLFVRARAIENRVPHVYVNRVGVESGRRYAGESVAVDAAGRALVAAMPGEAALRVADVPIGATVEPDYPRRERRELAVVEDEGDALVGSGAERSG